MTDSTHDLEVSIHYLTQSVEQLSVRLSKLEQIVLINTEDPSMPEFLKQRALVSPIEKTHASPPVSRDFEATFGARYLSRIGMIGLLLGIGFFLKYSFDNNWVGPFGRIIIGYLSGVILIAFGEWVRRKYGSWSRVFTGGGLAVLYFSTFAAQHFYSFFSLPVTILIMSLITAVAIVFSVMYESVVVALFALAGGFLTPLIIAGSAQDEAFLRLGYIVLLNIAIIIVSAMRRWHILDVLAFICTLLYMSMLYRVVSPAWAISFLTVYFILFSISNLFLHKNEDEERKNLYQATKELTVVYVIANATFYYWFLYQLLHVTHHDLVGIIALLLAVWYGVQMHIARVFSPAHQHTALAMLSVALAFVATGVGVVFDMPWAIMLWALYGVGVIWSGFYTQEKLVRMFGFVILLVPMVRFLYTTSWHGRPGEGILPVWNVPFLSGFIVLCALFAGHQIYAHYRSSLTSDEKSALPILAVVANFFALVLFTHEITTFVVHPQTEQTLVSVLWALQATLLVGAGIAVKAKHLRISGLILFAVTILKVLLIDLSTVDTIYRVLAFIGVGILLILASFL